MVDELLHSGCWELTESDYRIHDFLQYNPSAEQVRKERDDNARRQAEFKLRHKGETRGEKGAIIKKDGNGVSNALIIPSRPRPVPYIDSNVECKHEGGVGGEVPGADAPTPRKKKPSKSPETTIDTAPVSLAFTSAGLRDPLARDKENTYARHLIKQGFSPEEMVRCVRDIRAGEWGDGWLRDNCCLKTLWERDRMVNWAEWNKAGRPAGKEHRGNDTGYSQRNHI